MEVVKIRLQAQQHSLADPLEAPRYRNAGHAVYAIVREEGFSALYRGVTLTALRQATNQGALPVLCSRVLVCGVLVAMAVGAVGCQLDGLPRRARGWFCVSTWSGSNLFPSLLFLHRSGVLWVACCQR